MYAWDWNAAAKPLPLAFNELRNGGCIGIIIENTVEMHLELNDKLVWLSIHIGAAPSVDLLPLVEFGTMCMCA